MTTLVLRIEPELCGPVSIGTGSVVKLLALHLGLRLDNALELVSRAVYEGEAVSVPAPSLEAAAALLAAFAKLPPVPRVCAELVTE